MPSWKKLIVSGGSAALSSVTASVGFLGNLQGTATSASYVTGSIFTGSNLATSSSYAITASYALSSPGGGASPGGTQWQVQVNSGSGQFYADSGFVYIPATRKIQYTANRDFDSNNYDQNAASSFQLLNNNDSVFSKGHYSNLLQRTKLITKNVTTSIITFDVAAAVSTALTVTGFKCDYSIGYGNLTNGSPAQISDSRIGTIHGVWSWDYTSTNISDNHVISDAYGVLKDGVFQLTWGAGTVTLEYSTGPNISEDCVFNGLFTVFVNK